MEKLNDFLDEQFPLPNTGTELFFTDVIRREIIMSILERHALLNVGIADACDELRMRLADFNNKFVDIMYFDYEDAFNYSKELVGTKESEYDMGIKCVVSDEDICVIYADIDNIMDNPCIVLAGSENVQCDLGNMNPSDSFFLCTIKHRVAYYYKESDNSGIVNKFMPKPAEKKIITDLYYAIVFSPHHMNYLAHITMIENNLRRFVDNDRLEVSKYLWNGKYGLESYAPRSYDEYVENKDKYKKIKYGDGRFDNSFGSLFNAVNKDMIKRHVPEEEEGVPCTPEEAEEYEELLRVEEEEPREHELARMRRNQKPPEPEPDDWNRLYNVCKNPFVNFPNINNIVNDLQRAIRCAMENKWSFKVVTISGNYLNISRIVRHTYVDSSKPKVTYDKNNTIQVEARKFVYMSYTGKYEYSVPVTENGICDDDTIAVVSTTANAYYITMNLLHYTQLDKNTTTTLCLIFVIGIR